MQQTLTHYGSSILNTALYAVVVFLFWKYVAVPVFSAPAMFYGHAFATVLTVKILTTPLWSMLNAILQQATEANAIAAFNEQQSSRKFEAMAAWLDDTVKVLLKRNTSE